MLQEFVFSLKKQGHYNDWASFFEDNFRFNTLISLKSQLKVCLTAHTIIFLDGDKWHLLYFPIMLLRNISGRKSIIFSIRTEYLLRSSIKSLIKRLLYTSLISCRNIKIVSIHKLSKSKRISRYITDYIYDLQYWDLPYLNFKKAAPPEINNIQFKKPVLLIIGKLSDKRNKTEILSVLENNNDLNYQIIISSEMSLHDLKIFESNNNCIVVNRYVTNDELYYLYHISDIIFCYYNSVDRPSGIFGRAMQLGKYAVVKSDSYHSNYNRNYSGLIVIEEFSQLNSIVATMNFKKVSPMIYNDYTTLTDILYKWN